MFPVMQSPRFKCLLFDPFALLDMYIKVSRHNTDIAVLNSRIMSDKLAHDREMKDVKEALRSIAAKLDSIEQALREK